MATDALIAALLGQLGQRGQQADGQRALAARLLQPQAPAAPILSSGGSIAHALTQGINAFSGARMMADADQRETARQDALVSRIGDVQTQERARQQADSDRWAAQLFGRAPAADGNPPAINSPPPNTDPAPAGPAPSATPPASPISGAPLPPPDLMPHFEAASRETGIPVPLLIAQARQESNFNPNAVGRSGEIGVAQIMPSTARQPGYGVQPVAPEALRDPAANIQFGARYLAARGTSAGVSDWNDPQQAARGLTAYNGGGDPNYAQNVARYLPQTGAQPSPNVIPASSPAPAGAPPVPDARAGAGGQQPQINMEALQRMLVHPDERIRQQAQGVVQMLQLQRQQQGTPRTITTADGVFSVYPDGRRVREGDRPETAPRSNLAQKQELERAAAGRPSVEVRTGQNFGEQLASGAARQIGELRTAARTAAEGLRSADRIADLLNSGVVAGTAAPTILSIERALRTAGLIDGRRVANTEQLMAELARGTLDAAGGLTGPTSDNDIKFLREVVAGNIALTPETIGQVALIARERNERTITQYNDMAGIVSRDESLTPAMRELYRPLDFPTRAPRPADAPGTGTPGRVIEYDERGRRISR